MGTEISVPDPDLATDEEVAADVEAHRVDTSNVHGIPDTTVLETVSGAQAKADTAQTLSQAYADALIRSRPFKDPVRVVVTTGASPTGLGTFDGVSLADGDPVLRASASADVLDGIYIAHVGAWTRRDDADTSAEMKPGLLVSVQEGTANADSVWVLDTNLPLTLGTTPLHFRRADGRVTSINGMSGDVVGLVESVNGKTADVTGDVELLPIDLGIDITALVPSDIGAVAYPSGGSDGWVLQKAGAAATWANQTAAGTLTADALAGGVGLWGAQRVSPKFPALTNVVDFSVAGHGWTGGTDDTSVFRWGSQSLRLDPAVHASTITYVTSPTLGTTIDLTAKCLSLFLNVSSALIAGLTLEVSSNGGTNWSAAYSASRLNHDIGRWWTWRLNKNTQAANGSVNFAAINKIRIGARTPTGQGAPLPVYFERLATYDNTESKAVITWIIEAYQGQLAAGEAFKVYGEFISRGMRPTLLVRPNNVEQGINNMMTLAELQELHLNNGFGMVPIQWGETEINTANYSSTNPAEYEAGLLKSLRWFKDNGFERPRLGFSGTASGGATSTPFMRSYFESAMYAADDNCVNVFPTANPYALSYRFLFGGGSGMLNGVKTYIDRVVETKGLGVLYSVGLQEAAQTFIATGRSDVVTLLDYIIAKGATIEFLPMNEIIKNRF